jgi:hypothetical protein
MSVVTPVRALTDVIIGALERYGALKRYGRVILRYGALDQIHFILFSLPQLTHEQQQEAVGRRSNGPKRGY